MSIGQESTNAAVLGPVTYLLGKRVCCLVMRGGGTISERFECRKRALSNPSERVNSRRRNEPIDKSIIAR